MQCVHAIITHPCCNFRFVNIDYRSWDVTQQEDNSFGFHQLCNLSERAGTYNESTVKVLISDVQKVIGSFGPNSHDKSTKT